MKKLVLVLLALLLIPNILAINIEFSKPAYQPQETMQAEITGNFISLTDENILIYKQDIVHSTPVISGLTKQGDIYYFYALLPNQEANFSLKIEGVQYTQAGKIKTDAITKNFTIEKTNQSALQINPGFVLTSEDFSIEIRSLYERQDISARFNNQIENFSLSEDSEKTIVFSVSGLSGKQELKINDYNIPVFIIGKAEPSINISINQTQDLNQTTENQTKIDITELDEEEIAALSCIDIGEKCEDNEKCDGESVPSLDGPCCVGECIEKKKTNYNWIFGIAIIIFVLITIGFFYLKAKKRQKPKSTEEILKQKVEKFKERMQGENEEVSRSLGKV